MFAIGVIGVFKYERTSLGLDLSLFLPSKKGVILALKMCNLALILP